MRPLALLAVLLLVAGSDALTAQQPPPDPGPPAFAWQAGASVGTPLSGSATLVLMRARSGGIDGRWGENLVLDAGLGGGKARLGRFSYGANVGREYGLAVLHTWGDPWRVDAGQTFVGGELQLSALPLTVTVGGYGRVHGDAPGDDFLVSVTLGARVIPWLL